MKTTNTDQWHPCTARGDRTMTLGAMIWVALASLLLSLL